MSKHRPERVRKRCHTQECGGKENERDYVVLKNRTA
jgi:hypothetical protein